MGVFYRVAEEAGSDKSGSMSHIHHEKSSYLIRDLAYPGIVPFPRICRSTADDQLRLELESPLLHLLIVYESCLLVETI